MMTNRLLLPPLALVLLALPRMLAGQGRPGSVELGFDAGFEFSNVEDLDVDDGEIEFGDQVHVGIPIQRFRVGYHASDYISLEPSIGLDYQKIEDPRDDSDDNDISVTNVNFGMAALVHFRADPDNPVVYGIARGTYNLADVNTGEDDEDDDSATQFGLGGGLGIKLPVADRLDVRLEGTYERRFENEDDALPASNNYQAGIGFSWYTGER